MTLQNWKARLKVPLFHCRRNVFHTVPRVKYEAHASSQDWEIASQGGRNRGQECQWQLGHEFLGFQL